MTALAALVAWAGVSSALSSETAVDIYPREPRPGDLVGLRWQTSASTTVAFALFGGQRFALLSGNPGEFRGFLGIPIETEAGPHPLRLQVSGAPDLSLPLRVQGRSFGSSNLRVSKRFTKKRHTPPLVRRLEREREALVRVWARPPSPLRAPAVPVRPTRNRRVTAVYGTKRLFNGALRSRHYGLDLAGRVGDSVRAALDGRVVLSSMRYGSGGTLVIDHGGGLFTLYFHLSKRSVSKGTEVRRGQTVGAVGRTGRVTGPHLHLSVAVRAVSNKGVPWGMYVDPKPFLQGTFLDPDLPAAKEGTR